MIWSLNFGVHDPKKQSIMKDTQEEVIKASKVNVVLMELQ